MTNKEGRGPDGGSRLGRPEFSAWLRRLLERNGWTYAELADQIGKTHGGVGGWVRGTYRPDPDSLQALSDLTGTNIWVLANLAYGWPMPPVARRTADEPEVLRAVVHELRTVFANDPDSLMWILKQLQAINEINAKRPKKNNTIPMETQPETG